MRTRLLVAALATLVVAPAAADARTVWLCKPGLRDDPCVQPADTARFTPAGAPLGTDDPARTRRRAVDCFYVYPTVSQQPRPTATRSRDPEVRSIARFQAARFGTTCRLFAPVYRQVTLSGLSTATPADRRRAYRDVRAAWRAYLRRHNRGRGVVLIGHSQGTFHLRRLIADEIDGRRRVRRRLVSALLLGGDVTVAAGRDRGGDFRRIRACRSATQLRCVVAFSIYGDAVPPDALFGRTDEPGREVLCVNPAALGGGEGRLDPVLPREPYAPGTAIGFGFGALGFPAPAATATWLAFPGSYTARCVRDAGAHVLQVAPVGGAPVLRPVPIASWGLHLADVNLPLGNLEALVARQARAYARR